MPHTINVILRSAPPGRVSKDARRVCNYRGETLRQPADPFWSGF